MILEKKAANADRFSGLFSYTYNRAQYRDIDSEEWQPFKYDRRHSLTGLLNIRIIGNWSFSALGQLTTGYPFTNVLGMRQRLDADGFVEWDFVRDRRMGSRFPAMKKLDLRLSYQRIVAGRAFAFYLDLINVTNERNIHEITWEKQYLPDEPKRRLNV
ncbi:hypothetical protein MJD09_12395 [bacterium]|nr:hypothetical protein [bacterium]